jgi:hypothetical protein
MFRNIIKNETFINNLNSEGWSGGIDQQQSHVKMAGGTHLIVRLSLGISLWSLSKMGTIGTSVQINFLSKHGYIFRPL